jgi:uncharacterized Zn finger protein
MSKNWWCGVCGYNNELTNKVISNLLEEPEVYKKCEKCNSLYEITLNINIKIIKEEEYRP